MRSAAQICHSGFGESNQITDWRQFSAWEYLLFEPGPAAGQPESGWADLLGPTIRRPTDPYLPLQLDRRACILVVLVIRTCDSDNVTLDYTQPLHGTRCSDVGRG